MLTVSCVKTLENRRKMIRLEESDPRFDVTGADHTLVVDLEPGRQARAHMEE